MQNLFSGPFLAIHIDPHAGHGLIKQTVPRRTTYDMLVMQKTFSFFIQLVRAKDPDITYPGSIKSQRRSLELFLKCRIAELIYLKRKEHEMCRDIGHCFLCRLIEPSDLRVRNIGSMNKLRIAHDPRQYLVYLLV